MTRQLVKFLSMPLRDNGCRTVPFLIAILLTASNAATAAWHDKHSRADVAAHYVRLTGHGGDNDINRKNLIETHKACADVQAALGKPVKALSHEGVPPVIATQEIEIYYTANRTLTVKQGTLYYIDYDDCGLASTPHRILELRSAAGRCDIDMIKKEARGQCDAVVHEHAPPHIPSTAQVSTRKALDIDLDKVPQQMRAQVETQLERIEQQSRAGKDISASASIATGESKSLLNMSCKIYHHEALQSTWCVANPVPASNRPVAPYPIPAAPLNAGISGLLMEARTPALTLRAQQVRLNLLVSPGMFAVPAGVKIKSGAGGR